THIFATERNGRRQRDAKERRFSRIEGRIFSSTNGTNEKSGARAAPTCDARTYSTNAKYLLLSSHSLLVLVLPYSPRPFFHSSQPRATDTRFVINPRDNDSSERAQQSMTKKRKRILSTGKPLPLSLLVRICKANVHTMRVGVKCKSQRTRFYEQRKILEEKCVLARGKYQTYLEMFEHSPREVCARIRKSGEIQILRFDYP
ncbi:hypothetical protein ALC62_08756, partial [Cyphomyrmex costatus]